MTDNLKERIFFNLDDLIEKVKTEKVEVQVIIEPDRLEMNLQPWRPINPMCPYSSMKEAAQDDPEN